MADDIDALLDEVEASLDLESTPTNGKKQGARPGVGYEADKRSNTRNGEGELGDILHDDVPLKKAPIMKVRRSSIAQEIQKAAKCYPVYLGGSLDEGGITQGGHPKSCRNIRCTACDFDVVRFKDACWQKSVDYLFFRNNMPEVDKLKVKLKGAEGMMAYACQCKWRSFAKLTNITEDNDLKWVCGKHSL
eukprot:Nk52_evm26s1020 gene=Nk52_evmTU26s1020